MAIRFDCRCGRRIEVGDDAAGTPMRCSKCQHRLTVPFPKGVVEEIIPLAGEEPEVASATTHHDDAPPENHTVRLILLGCAVAVIAAAAGFGASWWFTWRPAPKDHGEVPTGPNVAGKQPQGNEPVGAAPLGADNQNAGRDRILAPGAADPEPQPKATGRESYPGEYAEYAQLAALLALDRPGKAAGVNSSPGGSYFQICRDAKSLNTLQNLSASKNEVIARIAAEALPEFRGFHEEYRAHANQQGGQELAQDPFLQQQAMLFEEYQRAFWIELSPVTSVISPEQQLRAMPIVLTISDQLHVENHTGQTLSDCTLQLVVEGFYGTRLLNTYFIDSWESGTSAGDGLHPGFEQELANAVRVRATVWSREASYAETVIELPEQFRAIATAKIADVRELISNHEYETARSRATIILDAVGHDDDFAQQVRDLIAESENKIALIAELDEQVLGVAAQLTPRFTFDGAWQIEQYDGELKLQIEKTLGDGSRISAVMFDERAPGVKKKLNGKLYVSLDKECLEIQFDADAASGIRGSPRPTPHSRNLLLQGDSRSYTFQWRDDHFLLEDESGFTLTFTPGTPLDLAQAAPVQLFEGAEFEGTIGEVNDRFPVNLKITQLDGNEFSATVTYSSLNARSRVTGTIDGEKIVYVEETVTTGPVVPGAQYTVFLDGAKWEGSWVNQGRSGLINMTRVVAAPIE